MDDAGYFVECGDTLANKLGITDPKELQETEYRLSADKTAEILARPICHVPDFEYLLSLHRHLFGELYDFAGKIRTVNIAKPDSPVPFCYADFIQSEANRIFTQLKSDNYLVGLDQPSFAHALAKLSSELNALHPFREGNGRAIRLFLDQICQNAGYIIDFTMVSHDEIRDADRAAFAGNLIPLKGLYSKIIQKL